MIRLDGLPRIAIDTECTGLHWWEDKLFGIALTLPDRRSFYYDVREDDLRWLGPELLKVPRYVMHNAKYDLHMLREYGIRLDPLRASCTMIRAALINENELKYDLDWLGKQYVGVGKDTTLYQKLADLFGGNPTKEAQMKNIARAPRSIVAPYAMQDTGTTDQLWLWQEQELDAQDLRLVESVEQRLLAVIVDCEHRGVRVDVEKAHEVAVELGRRIDTGQAALNKAVGFEVNVNPSKSLKELVAPYEQDGSWFAKDGTLLEKTDGGAPSITAKALEKMRFPEAKQVLALRKMRKTKETFIEGHLMRHHHQGVIHANYNQTKSDNDLGTGTGRLSMNDPPLQQIHKRDEAIASIVRALFLPDEGQQWSCHDYSQMDFRMFAHYTKSPPVLAAYAQNPDFDFHQLTSDLTGLPRKAQPNGGPYAKAVNLGNVFGMGAGLLAQMMGMPYTVEHRNGRAFLKGGPEVMAMLEHYHRAIPGVREFLREAESIARSRGYVRTILKRRIRFPLKGTTYKAAGLIFQGSAADALKLKLVAVWELLQSTEARLMLNVHDEFDLSTPPDPEQRINKAVRAEICDFGERSPVHFDVPIRSDMGVGPNWWEASK